jgi:hypothetical protein
LFRGHAFLVELENLVDRLSTGVCLRAWLEGFRSGSREDWLQMLFDLAERLEHLAEWTIRVRVGQVIRLHGLACSRSTCHSPQLAVTMASGRFDELPDMAFELFDCLGEKF